MNLARFSVNRPVAAGIISVALFVLGLYYMNRLPVNLYPQVSFPFVSVVVPVPGATAEQIEKKVVKPLEKELAGVADVKRVIAQIKPGYAQLILGFRMSTDEREAVNNVRDKVSAVRAQFPDDAEEPVVSRIDVGATPVLIYGIEANGAAPEAIKKKLDDTLIPALQRTDGVNEAQIVGLGDEQVEISLDPARLSGLRVAPLDVYQQLASYVKTIPWGDLQQGPTKLTVSRSALPSEPEYWQNYSLTLADGRSVRLGEIADVKTLRDPDAPQVRINGKAGLGLVITKRASANTVDVVEAAETIIGKFSGGSGVKLFPIVDQSSYIEENAHEVWVALFAGGTFAVFVVLLFLTDLKSALITATALPVSVAGAFIGMSYFGFSLNMMSLLALSLAIGLLIDDAVVVREAIFAEMEGGKSAKEAAVSGTDRVASAVMATTLAVVAVFVPVALMEGMVGQFFKEFGLTIVVSVVLSLWVAFTLDPMLSAKFGGHHKPLPGRFWDAWRGLLTRADHAAGRLAAWAFARPWRVAAFATVLLASSGALLLSRGADFLAFEDRGQLVVDLTAPAGTPKERMLTLADEAHERLKGLDGLVDVYTKTGGLRNNDAAKAEMRLVFVPKTQREKGLIAIQKEANERLEGLGAKYLVMEPPPIEGVGSEAPLAIYLYGDDYTKLFAEAERIEGEIAKLPGVGRVRLETRPIVPGIDITLDPGELGFWHTSASTVELTGRLALTGLEAGSVGADNVPMMVRYREDARTLDALWNDTYVPTPKGPVLLSQLAQAGDSKSPTSIDRERRSRKVVVWATMDRSRSYGLVLADVEALLASVPAPMFGEIAGDKEFFEEMTSNFAIAIVGSAFFIFVILAIQFENLLRPFIIILTLPLAAIGAFLALYVAGEKLALGALIGIILLIGLAAKNGILLVDAVGSKEKELGLLAAVRRAVEERFRPIVMTSVAMIFGMLPTAVMRGGGSEFRAPMAIAIIGGVISSTLLSLVIVPAVFGLLEKLGAVRERLSRTSGKRRPAAAAAAAAVVVVLAVAFALWSRPAEAEAPTPASAKPAASTEKRADMAQVKSILREPLSPEGAEALSILAAQSAAEGLTTASRLAFGGVMKAEAGRQWTRPGVEQEVTLPLPPQVGGPVTTRTTVVPKEQDLVEVSWGLPLFNMQVIRGLEVASEAREQQGIVEKLQKETAAQTKAQLLLQYEMAAKVLRVQEERARIAEQRLKMVESRTAAGTARRIQLDEASANLEAARADLERARAGLARARAAFASESSAPLPDEGLGLPQFPLAEGRPLNAHALAALRGTERIQEAQVSVNDAAFLPTLEAGAAHQRKLYDGAPEPQNVVSVKLSWTLLDAGTRRRNAAEQTSALYRAKAQTASLAKELKVAHDTLPSRVAGARHGLAARQAALRAAESAVEDSLAAYRSGAGQLIDVRSADEMRLTAELAVYQAEIELQGLALESLVLSGGLLDYIAR